MEPQLNDHPTATAAETATLLISFELSQSEWVLTIQQPHSSKLSRFTVPARDTAKVLSLLTTQRAQAERRVGRAVKIVSIYQAGLDGFWLHRWLEAQGIESHVVDPASILGPQRKRKAKHARGLVPGDGSYRRGEIAAQPGGLAGRRTGRVLDDGATERGAGRLPAPVA